MHRFERNDERLGAFMRTLWEALVPENGECISVQGELVRASARLQSEHYRNGMANYYTRDEPEQPFEKGYYPALLLFIADTIVADTRGANDAAAVAYFREVRARARRDWDAQQRINDICDCQDEENRELTDEEAVEIEALENADYRIEWEELFERAEIAVANYCLAHPLLVDKKGARVEEHGVKDLRHVFEPPPAAPPCPLCNDKGWLTAPDATQFPSMCSCKAPTVLH